MAQHCIKYLKSKYKYVEGEIKGDVIKWQIRIQGVTRKRYDTEIEAAINADIFLIKQGKKPVNILTKKRK